MGVRTRASGDATAAAMHVGDMSARFVEARASCADPHIHFKLESLDPDPAPKINPDRNPNSTHRVGAVLGGVLSDRLHVLVVATVVQRQDQVQPAVTA